jgi:hypothetical protein
MIFGVFTLFVALTISAIAAFYSIAGLTAIFSTAVLPIIIMGAALEIGKITAAMWLKLNWSRAKWTYKIYLVPAVAVLMLLTSMGIFGFLSKAHSDQTLITGNSAAQLSIVDEKIKIQRDNLQTARAALAQLDAQVNERLSRGNSEQGVERAATLRRQQQAERARLLKDIENAQTVIQKLNEERAPMAANLRKVESEVGPIKYIAALVYGPNPDADLLEKAVSWMIIVIVAVFDPLALVLILAAQQSITWQYQNRKPKLFENPFTIEETLEAEKKTPLVSDPPTEVFDIKKHAYLFKPWVWPEKSAPIPGNQISKQTVEVLAQNPAPTKKRKAKSIIEESNTFPELVNPVQVTDQEDVQVVDKDTVVIKELKIKKLEGNYYEVNDKKYSQEVFFYMWPDIAKKFEKNLHRLQADNSNTKTTTKTSFGTAFPVNPAKADLFLRVDLKPNKLFKYNGFKWIEVDKNKTDSYSYDDKYIEFVIEKLQTGDYELDQLTATEQDLVAEKLKQKTK